jgi:predicted ATPase
MPADTALLNVQPVPRSANPMTGSRPLQQLTLSNFLSYRKGSELLDLLALNVLIGPNASGKSNLIEALAVLRGAAGDLATVLREGGGIGEYIHKKTVESSFQLEVTVDDDDEWSPDDGLFYRLTVAEASQRAEVTHEVLREAEKESGGDALPQVYYSNEQGYVVIASGGSGAARRIRPEDLTQEQSILSQRRDPDLYPQLTYVGDLFRRIAIYREWTFGVRTKARGPQPTDLPTDFLLPDASNLALVLHELVQRSATRKLLMEYLRRFYASAEHIATRIQGGTVQLFIEEAGDVLVPATRLSDGTLRYLSLLAILCHPTPPPIVCIEEPELGLHPDIMPTIAELLKDASQRTQLIVTTHSDALVSALSDTPEAVVICEPGPDGTQLRRLDREALAEWLERYSLGEIWRMGEIGGTRW